tara:strand:- start:266 stop:715 length:450 start_codon:yes stop_codon:yes gene_type:complete
MSLDLKLEEYFNGSVKTDDLVCSKFASNESYEHLGDINQKLDFSSYAYYRSEDDDKKFSTQFSTMEPLKHSGYYRRSYNGQVALTLHNTAFLTQGMFQISYSVLSVKYKTVTGENTNPYNKVRKFVNNSTYIYPRQLKNMCLTKYEIKP